MDFRRRFSDESSRKEELIRNIESALSKLSVNELEAISYDLVTKGDME